MSVKVARVSLCCAECGATFLTYPCHAKRAKYCSVACYRIAQRGRAAPHARGSMKRDRVRPCDACGVHFLTHRNYTPKYCSEECRQTGRKRSKRPMTHIMSRYGITYEEYQQMILQQSEKCVICKVTFAERGMHRVHVDHDHVTGLVRGLLCRGCNMVLHRFVTIETLQAAITYLEAAVAEDTVLTPAQAQ